MMAQTYIIDKKQKMIERGRKTNSPVSPVQCRAGIQLVNSNLSPSF
jgi:hypothetical protein